MCPTSEDLDILKNALETKQIFKIQTRALNTVLGLKRRSPRGILHELELLTITICMGMKNSKPE